MRDDMVLLSAISFVYQMYGFVHFWSDSPYLDPHNVAIER